MAQRKMALALALMAATTLAACDNGPSAVAKKRAAAETQVADAGGSSDAPTAPRRSSSRYADSDSTSGVDHRKDDVPELDGKPMWSASRRYSAEDSAKRAFERNGEVFGARDVQSFARKAHAFVEHPPKGVQTLTRANGDTLFYDPKGNVFAVADKAGTPRTMFKPDDGATYWQEQKDRESKRRTSRASRSDRADEAG
jgi:pyocin large subunit-like protein